MLAKRSMQRVAKGGRVHGSLSLAKRDEGNALLMAEDRVESVLHRHACAFETERRCTVTVPDLGLK